MNLNNQSENNTTRNSVIFLFIFFFVAATAMLFILAYYYYGFDDGDNIRLRKKMDNFSSCGELSSTLNNYSEKSRSYSSSKFGIMELSLDSAPTAELGSAAESVDYSETNVQVAGVDEADKVKTDGEYIYTISGKSVTISKAYPTDDAALVSAIDFDSNDTLNELFLDEDSMLVFGTRTFRYEDYEVNSDTKSKIYPHYYSSVTFVEIFNIKDKTKPELERKLEFEGTYGSSRKIDKYVYFILNSYPNYSILEEGNMDAVNILPAYRDLHGKNINNADENFKAICDCKQVSYIDPILKDNYLTIVGLPINDYDKDITSQVILGASDNIYASTENLYIANTEYDYYSYGLWDEGEDWSNDREKTTVYKFSLDKDEVEYQGNTKVPGTVLNQFSMDEYDDHFRIATTIGNVSRSGDDISSNNIYVLDNDLKIVGSIEDIAPGEKIYSARFMGKKGYLVTFKKIDPFFTFDLSDHENPKIIGKLKIPGYSDYLHPYDEDHIIGIGKETVEAEEEGFDFVWHQGVKMAIFDVTDFANPIEMYKTTIGDRGTDSEILYDHKALLFDRDKNLLVIPIRLAELTQSEKEDSSTASNAYGDYTFQGAYVYDISLNNGFQLKSRITHFEDDDLFKKSGYYFGNYANSVDRSLYIGDYLYTISQAKIFANQLDTLEKVTEIDLGYEDEEEYDYDILY